MSATISLSRFLDDSESSCELVNPSVVCSCIKNGNINEALAKPNFPYNRSCSCKALNGKSFSGFDPSLKNTRIVRYCI